MAKIFLSYARESRPLVEGLVADLAALNHMVWFDHKLTGGHSWWDRILEEIRACDVFLFVLDPASLASTACQREYRYAAAVGAPILPVLVSETVNTTLLPVELQQIQFVDHIENDRAAAFRLAGSLSAIPLRGPLPDPLPTPPDAPLSYLAGLAQRLHNPAPMDRDAQAALVFEIRQALRKPEDRADAMALMDRFQARDDLLAIVADELRTLAKSYAGGGQVEPPPTRLNFLDPARRRPQPDPQPEPQPKTEPKPQPKTVRTPNLPGLSWNHIPYPFGLGMLICATQAILAEAIIGDVSGSHWFLALLLGAGVGALCGRAVWKHMVIIAMGFLTIPFYEMIWSSDVSGDALYLTDALVIEGGFPIVALGTAILLFPFGRPRRARGGEAPRAPKMQRSQQHP